MREANERRAQEDIVNEEVPYQVTQGPQAPNVDESSYFSWN